VMSPGVKSLGRFNLVGIPPAPRGMPQIEVSFDIDANGIVNVNAKDMATGKEQAMTITGGTALSKDEIDRMVKEAESFAAEDHKRREAAEVRNQADQVAYTVGKSLGEWGDKVPQNDKDELVAANDELKEALKNADADAETLRTASDKVMGIFSRVGQAIHQNVQAPDAAAAGAEDGAQTPSGEDEVVEGEIVEEGGAS
jgi:molecular chaperone DnaK